jgi:hypothetical protein
MNQQQDPQQKPEGQPSGGMQQPGEMPPDEESNVSPDEQEAYNVFVSNGMELLYSEQVMPQVLEAIKGDDNPVEGLANALAMIVLRLDESAGEAGQEVSGDVKFHGATELLEQMAELAEEAGIHEFSEEDMEAALYQAMDVYRSVQGEQGKLPTEDLSQDMQELMALNESGRMDEVFPGLDEFAAKRAPKEEPQGDGLMRR